MLRIYCDTTRLLNFGRTSIVQCDNDSQYSVVWVGKKSERKKKRKKSRISRHVTVNTSICYLA